jgi:hypothetical protein
VASRQAHPLRMSRIGSTITPCTCAHVTRLSFDCNPSKPEQFSIAEKALPAPSQHPHKHCAETRLNESRNKTPTWVKAQPSLAGAVRWMDPWAKQILLGSEFGRQAPEAGALLPITSHEVRCPMAPSTLCALVSAVKLMGNELFVSNLWHVLLVRDCRAPPPSHRHAARACLFI